MFTKTVVLGAMASALCCGSQALAETPAHDDPPGCFDVIAISPQALKAGSILVNRCSGETWLLMADQAASQGHMVYRWHPIRRASEEAAALAAGLRGSADSVGKGKTSAR
ncbi:MAG TPA: hypothetical protein VFO61_03380 [Alphaproteobacteria bacterium]|nr:hypothetical protein [Alphaproteobacteria bacterium]